jgi:L-lactate dehydrogenase (cytochrome)
MTLHHAAVEDLRKAAKRRLPHALFEFIDGGAGDESGVAANTGDFAKVLLRMKVMRGVATRDLSTTALGRPIAMPLAIAPTGSAGMVARQGELQILEAAAAAGIPFCQSTMSMPSVEQVAAAAPDADRWFQLYVLKDRGLTRALVERAKAAGCRALLVTLDVPVQGRRRRDIRTGFTVPPRFNPRTLADLALRPGWVADVLLGPKITFGNFEGMQGLSGTVSIASAVNSMFDLDLAPKDLTWLKDVFGGPVVAKGVMEPDDAAAAVDAGCDAVVVSNHGGRQLEGTPSSIRALPAIVERVGNRAEVWLDGGVRSGHDVVRALALGARLVLIGRATLWGLAVGGTAGVAHLTEIFRKEMDSALAMMGEPSMRGLTRDAVIVPREWGPTNWT